MNYINFNRKKDAAFAASTEADQNTIYFTSDTNELYIEGKSYGKLMVRISEDDITNMVLNTTSLEEAYLEPFDTEVASQLNNIIGEEV